MAVGDMIAIAERLAFSPSGINSEDRFGCIGCGSSKQPICICPVENPTRGRAWTFESSKRDEGQHLRYGCPCWLIAGPQLTDELLKSQVYCSLPTSRFFIVDS